MARNSIIKLCKNIKVDRGYQNCLTYSETEMVTLCNNNLIVQGNNFSFIREEENAIIVPFSYSDCLISNYIAFQNPRYNNKWFFAFVDSVNYVSDSTTRINFTIDEFSTWYSYWSPASCFVIREHVNNDTPYTNLIDEGLSIGDYVVNNSYDIPMFNYNNFKVVIGVSEIITSSGEVKDVPKYSYQGNVFSGVCYITPTGTSTADDIVRLYDYKGKADAIKYMFMCPNEIINQSQTYVYSGAILDTTPEIHYSYAVIDNNASYNVDFGTFVKPTLVDTYNPVNKKLLQYPYSFINLDPHSGSSYTFNYEDFHLTNNRYGFSINAILSVGCSVKVSPIAYKISTGANHFYGFTGVKFPICSWNSDVYTNWLTQNGINLGFTTLNQNEAAGLGAFLGLAGGIAQLMLGSPTGGASIGGTFGNIFQSMQSNYKADMIPNQVRGNENAGDINFSIGLVNPTVYEMSIKKEVAKTIDDFFTKYGYKINEIKTPNQTGRRYFNYVQIGSSEIIGYPKANLGVPADSMERINNIYRSGVTLWHDHSRIGNYADNTINT